MNAWFAGDEVHGEQAEQLNPTAMVPAYRSARNRARKHLARNQSTSKAMNRRAIAGDESLVSQLHRYFGGRAEVGAPPMLAGASFNFWVNPGVQVIYIKVLPPLSSSLSPTSVSCCRWAASHVCLWCEFRGAGGGHGFP
jgi:hypothetical protein